MRVFAPFPAKESLNRFRKIETDSGIEFFSEVGFLIAGSRSSFTEKEFVEKEALAEALRSEGHEIRKVSFR